MRGLEVLEAGPGLSLQDCGRAMGMGIGLSPGGAADKVALVRGHALFGHSLGSLALEMAGYGGRFKANGNLRIALTGAEMRASLNGGPLPRDMHLTLKDGEELQIGAAVNGQYGYLHVDGGFDAPNVLGGSGYHSVAQLGSLVKKGQFLTARPVKVAEPSPLFLPPSTDDSSPIRVISGPQSELFSAETRKRFEETVFQRSHQGNRQGVKFDQSGPAFAASSQLDLASDFVIEGDIQLTGDGTPYVLLADCQTMGGYPRIGTVLPADVPRISQSLPGSKFRFSFVELSEAERLWTSFEDMLTNFKGQLQPRVRNPHEMSDLLSYDLIGRPQGDVTD